MAQAVPDAKLIFIMRYPVARAYSHYLHRYTKELYRGKPFTIPFEEHVVTDPMCLDGSDYQQQIEQYLEYYSKESLLCLFHDDLRKNANGLLRKIFRFIGVDDKSDLTPPNSKRVNEASAHREHTIRMGITGPLKQMPRLSLLASMFPHSFRDGIYTLLRKTKMGINVADEMLPSPMRPEIRAVLIERFRQSNLWVSEFSGVDLSHWNL